ncbi:MAG: hypothetical protein HZB54_00015 [Deltaproteobacteria bacterium]|nr:hypothetical protein [Deltaproteobacteria bacterium]
MAKKLKKNTVKKGSSPRGKKKDGLIIVPEGGIIAHWYLQGRNLILIIIGAVLFLVFVVFVMQRIEIKEPDKPQPAPQAAKPVQPKPESAISGDVKNATQGLPAKAGNTPRIVKLKLLPVSPRKGGTLIVQAQAVVDGNSEAPVDFIYEWSINDNLINTETGPTLKNMFKKGDRVSVVITPEAGGVRGIPLTQTAKIGNSHPVVKSELADVKVKGNSYGGRVQAEDPDGDTLVYTLLKGPKNMTIDRLTGVITGEYQQTDAGKHILSISVKDSDNAEVVLDIPLELGFGR